MTLILSTILSLWCTIYYGTEVTNIFLLTMGQYFIDLTLTSLFCVLIHSYCENSDASTRDDSDEEMGIERHIVTYWIGIKYLQFSICMAYALS